MSNEVDKGLRQGVMDMMQPSAENKKRGINIYTYSQLLGITAKTQSGEFVTSSYDNPYFYLSPEDRCRIAQVCTPVLGVVTSRMHRIAGTKWAITNDKIQEERKVDMLRDCAQVYKEYSKSQELMFMVVRARMYSTIKETLFDILPDLSNFEGCLVRWRRRSQALCNDKNREIEEWLQQPNANDRWDDFVRKMIFDLHVHGSCALYKETLNNRLENIHILPGGTVIPVREKHISSQSGFLQIVDGFEPQIFYPAELTFMQYIPTSMRSYPLVPLEALINKIAETLFFDKLMADQADGTKPPDKAIIINTGSPFGGDQDLIMPSDMNEQKRIEDKINTPMKGAIMTMSGTTATVIDLSRENTMSIQMERQKDIREEVAMVFNMSNMEVNLTGGDDTSGRSTSDSQRDIDQGKGVVPILRLIETRFSKDIIPFRFGFGYSLEFQASKNENEEVALMAAKVQSGIYSVNEVRLDKNMVPFDKEEMNYPTGAQPSQNGMNQMNPMFMKQVQ